MDYTSVQLSKELARVESRDIFYQDHEHARIDHPGSKAVNRPRRRYFRLAHMSYQ